MKKTGKLDPKKTAVFFDFDNTVTTFDVLDDMLERFSKDEAWIGLEKRWKAGKIGSRECLEGQMKGLRINKKRLDSYLAGIKIDPYFKKILGLLGSARIPAFILSDNFKFILKSILRYNNISGLKLYSNSLRLSGERLIPSFPLASKTCSLCANCKKEVMLSHISNGTRALYIGDGLSDVCPSRFAAMVFAKHTLLKYCREEGLNHVPFNSLKDVYLYLKRGLA